MRFHLEIIPTNSNILSFLPSFSNIIGLFYKVLLQKSFVEIEFLLYITQCIVDYSRQCKTQIVIGFIVSSRLICLELVCTLKISGGEYNLKDSGLIHALEPCHISSSIWVSFACSRFSSPKICTNNFKVIFHDDYHNTWKWNTKGVGFQLC